MKITALHVTDFKRIRDIKLAPDADRVLMLVGGKNAQGKSSLFDAFTAALGGKNAQPADPVRHGAEQATIRLELDGGAVTITRTIKKGGESFLEVREEGGRVRSPQATLDKLVGQRFLDPLEFDSRTPAEQRARLLTLVAGAERLAELDKKRERAFDARTENGRELKRAQAELERTPEVKPGEPVDIAALSLEQRKLDDVLRAGESARAKHVRARETREQTETAITDLDGEIDRLQKKRADLLQLAGRYRDAEAEAKAVAENVPGTADVEKRRDEILFELKRAQEHNAKVSADQAAAARRTQVAGELAAYKEKAEQLNGVIETIDGRKAQLLAEAKLPVPGLGVDDKGVTLNGVPLAQASAAERLRVSLGLAIAAAPGLRDVWIRDGSLLDDDSLALVEEHATAAGCRVWLERVGIRDVGAIIIHDGGVAS